MFILTVCKFFYHLYLTVEYWFESFFDKSIKLPLKRPYSHVYSDNVGRRAKIRPSYVRRPSSHQKIKLGRPFVLTRNMADLSRSFKFLQKNNPKLLYIYFSIRISRFSVIRQSRISKKP